MTNKTLLLGGDIEINRLGFGAMRLPRGTFTGPTRDPGTGRAVLRRALELGVNHIDTAWFYRSGDVAANDLIREALSPYPEGLSIATKVGPLLAEDGIPSKEAGPDELRALVEDNLSGLGLERLDLVYLRVGGMAAPGGQSIGARFKALARLRDEGLIRHLGVSNVDLAQLREAQNIAPIAAVQNSFHVHHRGDGDLLGECEASGIAFVPFFPLGGGRDPIEAARVEKVAARHGATTAQISLAWLLAISPVTVAIAGTGSLDHLAENMAAGDIELSDQDLLELAA